MARLSTNHATWLVILTFALAARLAAGAWWQSRIPPEQEFYFGDSLSYWVLGQTIERGEPYEYRTPDYRVFRAPGYPLLLAGLFRVFGDNGPVMAARALSAVLGTLAVAVIGWWATRLFDRRSGLWAGWIAALYPGGVSMGAFVLSEAPFCPFMLFELALWGLAWRAASNKHAAALAAGAGAAAAIATLIRPSWLLFTPLALAIGLAIDNRRRRQLLMGAVVCASFAACMLPWWIRNAHVTGHFVATTLQVGASLYDGLNPTADGGSNLAFVPEFVAAERAAGASGTQHDMFEYRLDRRMTAAAVAWAREHPGRAAQLALIKFVRFWNVWPNEPSLRDWPLRLVVFCTYAPLLCLGVAGAWRFTPRGWPYVLAWLPAIYFTLLHAVFVSSIRYREPAMLALGVLAAGVLAGAARTESCSSAVAPGRTACPG
jgi:4-amino-4-deoxy-L-arabinose transferase-like glycosyltransferase